VSGAAVEFRDAVRVWARVGLQSFGGPAGQIAVMHRILVEEKRWVSEERFLHALNYCMLLPGPEAQQLATYIGWLLHGTRGGLVAGVLFVVPGIIAILGLSILYALYRDVGAVEAGLFGLKAAVLAVVVQAVIRIGRRVLKNGVLVGVAAAAFLGIFVWDAPFPVIVAGAAAIGLLAGARRPHLFAPAAHGPAKHDGGGDGAPVVDALLEDGIPEHARASLGRAVRVVLVWGALWLVPVIALGLGLGMHHVLTQEGVFFSKMAVVTFGGAYAVLAYVAQQAVEHYGWVAPHQMLDGLGMAETTPGPLIMVVQFVGFMGAYQNPGDLPPMVAGIAGALLTTWVTFTPCFLWIFLGAPYVEKLRGNRRLAAGLTAITAAVVGVILNLAVWFGAHVLFRELDVVHGPLGSRMLLPRWDTIDLAALAIGAGAFIVLLRFKWGMVPTLAAAMAAGAALRALAPLF
jgi:chromate transporter